MLENRNMTNQHHSSTQISRILTYGRDNITGINVRGFSYPKAALRTLVTNKNPCILVTGSITKLIDLFNLRFL